MLGDRATVIDLKTAGDLGLKTADELLTALTEIQQFRADIQELERQILAEQLQRLAGN